MQLYSSISVVSSPHKLSYMYMKTYIYLFTFIYLFCTLFHISFSFLFSMVHFVFYRLTNIGTSIFTFWIFFSWIKETFKKKEKKSNRTRNISRHLRDSVIFLLTFLKKKKNFFYYLLKTGQSPVVHLIFQLFNFWDTFDRRA